MSVNFDIIIADTVKDFSLLESDWKRIVKENGEEDFYLSYEWFYAVVNLHSDAPEILRVMSFREEGRVVAIIPCCLAKRNLRGFSFTAMEIIGNMYYSPRRGCIVRKGYEKAIADALADFLLKSSEWEVIYFEDLSPSDPFMPEFIDAFQKRNILSLTAEKFVNLIADLSCVNNSQDYWEKLLSAKQRKNIRQYVNRISRICSAHILLMMEPGQNVDTGMDHYDEIYSASWKDREPDPAFHRKLANYLLDKGCLRLFLLYLCPDRPGEECGRCVDAFDPHLSSARKDLAIPEDHIPVAAEFFVVQGRHACALKTAYRQDYSSYSPSTFLTWFALKWLIDVDRIVSVDFQRGHEGYKYKWARVNEENIYIYMAANPISFRARLHLLGEMRLIPILRKVKNKIEGRIKQGSLAEGVGRDN